MVLDASVVLSFALDEGEWERIEPVFAALESMRAIVPGIWPAEVANALVVAERRKRISAGELQRIVSDLSALPIDTDIEGIVAAFDRALPIARANKLTVYDSLYLELAMRLSLPLATIDDDLATAARKLSVALIIE